MGKYPGQMPPVCLDDEGTWPVEVVTRLSDAFPLLKKYEEVREFYDRMGTVEYLLLEQPSNPHRVERDQIISDIQDAIYHRDLLGYHCTRLTNDEAELIIEHGLQPLTSELIAHRIRARVCAGDLNDRDADKLISQSGAAQKNCAGKIWFVFTRSMLRDESGVGFLLGLWGGEATYGNHDDNIEIVSALRRIGFATLVEAAVPIAHIQNGMPVSERLVAAYLGRRDVQTRSGPEMDGHINCPVLPSRLITETTPEFVALTGWDTWTGDIFR